MSVRHAVPTATLAAQHRASDPAVSAWVSANAGSGKTHVLAQRVVRLLLNGTPPGRILCLTFTKTAAANMAARVFDQLAQWTLMDDDELKSAIAATGSRAAGPGDLALARRLFARTLETPGGLKIQTIHAFCERLLHLFPFEANVPAGFEVIEDQRQQELMLEARTAALEAAVHDEEGLGPALAVLAGITSPETFTKLLAEALGLGRDLAGSSGAAPGRALARALGIAAGETPDTARLAALRDGIAPESWGEIALWLATGTSNDQDRAHALQRTSAAFVAGDLPTALDAYFDIFFTENGTGTARKSVVTKGLSAQNPGLAAALLAEGARLAAARQRVLAAQTLERSTALATLARAVFARYEALKAARSLLDFKDLIQRTRSLFSRSEAAWVLYKLDGNIDHILVDEAQDTSPDQWEIFESLAADFTVGAGQRNLRRTLFAVGDEKQSIYSFQGAAPHMFAAMKRQIGARVAAAGGRFEPVDLRLSFRSAPAILAAVDAVFAVPENYRGLSGDGDNLNTVHEALKTSLRGHVEIWAPIVASKQDAPVGWQLPLDQPDPGAPATRLASRISDTIAAMIAPGSPDRVEDRQAGPRPVRAGDILILVRSRSAFFEEVIRALKDRSVPVAGADRMVLTDHIAVMDLVAVGQAALLPDDDLTLAVVLKSPFIGMDDDDLMAIAPQRTGSLWPALQAAPGSRFQDAAARLAAWQADVQALGPFGFYSRLLGAQGGRRQLTARLGFEAGDAIDEFLALALAHERQEAPSLARFLGQLQATSHMVKRDMDAPGDAVRVMTVHGAKGLEAKIVFLPDTCSKPGAPRDPTLFRLEPAAAHAAGDISAPGMLAWSAKAADDPAAVATAREETRRLAREEFRRLLYVAMTRAEERLYVSGFALASGPVEGCWHQMIFGALAGGMETVPAPWSAGEGEVIWRSGPPLVGVQVVPAARAVAVVAPPAWLHRRVPFEAASLPPLRPSQALEAADRMEGGQGESGQGESGQGQAEREQAEREPGNQVEAGLARQVAMARGRHLHVLMQFLPVIAKAERRSQGENYLAAQPDIVKGAAGGLESAGLLDSVLAAIEDQRLACLFGEGALAEVPIAGHIGRDDGTIINVSGQIDRLAVVGEEVWIADFKTGQPRGQVPDAIMTQMALYRALVGQIYPGRRVRALVVWTQGPEITELADAPLDAALARLCVSAHSPERSAPAVTASAVTAL